MEKHTPGEWQLERHSKSIIHIKKDDPLILIASLPHIKGQADWNTFIANAQLIVNAPYLLETLKDIEILTRQEDAIKGGVFITEAELLQGISQYAKIGIAKAEGKK